MPVSCRHPLGAEISEALGLKNVTELKLILKLGHIATVEATYYPEAKEMEKLIPILKKYRLEEIK